MPPVPKTALGRALREVGTLQQVAKLSGYSTGYLNGIARGVCRPSDTALRVIAQVVGKDEREIAGMVAVERKNASRRTTAAIIDSRLATWRRRAGLTQEQLGEMVGVSQRAVAYWEDGTYDASKKEKHALAAALDVPVKDVFAAFHVRARRGQLSRQLAASPAFWERIEGHAAKAGRSAAELLVEWATDAMDVDDASTRKGAA